MGQVVTLTKPIEKLILEIRAHVHDAGRAETTCAKHQLQAGWALLALRKRIEDGEEGQIDWWTWYDTKFTGHIKSRKYAERLMKWARADDPDGAREADLARRRELEPRATKRELDTRVSEVNEEYDIVEHALRLVAKMSPDELEQFDQTYRSKFQ